MPGKKAAVPALTLAIVAIVAIAACVSQQSSTVVIYSGASRYAVEAEVADNAPEWQQGLMNRSYLEENKGMLFVFPDSRPRAFWMKNTLIPLDIIFISPSFSIVDIATMQPCKAEPCPTYTSKDDAKYVLEVNAGYAAARNITVGDSVSFYFTSNQTS